MMNTLTRNITFKGLLFKAASILEKRERRRVDKKVVGRSGLQVRSGPFAGMKYSFDSHGSELAPKLLGSYEAELVPTLMEWCSKQLHTVVDIGCAEGYYAVGLALLLPSSRVYAYDTSDDARRACARLATLNGVAERVEVRGRCTPHELEHLIGGPSMIIVDCEGAEVDVLRPDIAPVLRGAHLLIELHDFFVPGASRVIAERFAPSHDVVFIAPAHRNPADFPELAGLSASDQYLAMDERRMPQEWVALTPRT